MKCLRSSIIILISGAKKAIKSICELLSCKTAGYWLNFGFSEWMNGKSELKKSEHTINRFVYGFQWNFTIGIDKLFSQLKFKRSRCINCTFALKSFAMNLKWFSSCSRSVFKWINYIDFKDVWAHFFGSKIFDW